MFEAKDKRLSKNEAWASSTRACSKRDAVFAVLVVAGDDNVPAGREQLTEYEGNKMIVAVDRDEPDGLALELAYRLAAARVAMARDRDRRVDAAAVRDAADEAVSLLKQAQAVRSSLTGIKTSSAKARDGLDGWSPLSRTSSLESTLSSPKRRRRLGARSGQQQLVRGALALGADLEHVLARSLPSPAETM